MRRPLPPGLRGTPRVEPPVSAQLAVSTTFAPSEAGGLRRLGYDPDVVVELDETATPERTLLFINGRGSRLALQRAQHVEVTVRNALRQQVARLHEGAATQPFTFEAGAGGLPSRVYLIRVVGERFTATTRAVLME